jgi:N-glycosylase/DNA lyase
MYNVDVLAKIIDDSTIWVFDKTQFDMYAIQNCGQIFLPPNCVFTDGGDKIIIKGNAHELYDYFDLGLDYNEVKKQILLKVPQCQKGEIQKAINAGGGIRILRQPFVPCVISFIISANNNIKRFTKTLAQIDFNNLESYTEADFTKIGCGYRAPYLVKAIQQLKSLDFAKLSKLDNAELKKTLLTLSGVGPKVAACIMLFAFHRLDTVPVDTWVKKSRDFIPQSEFAGVLQQYIFYYTQHLKQTMGV